MADSTNQSIEPPLPPVFIPELSKALEPFLVPGLLYAHPQTTWSPGHSQMGVWQVANPCPHHITYIIQKFFLILGNAGLNMANKLQIEYIAHHMDEKIEEMCQAPTTPAVASEVLRGIDVLGTIRSVHSQLLENPLFADESWLVKCATHPDAQLDCHQVATMNKMLKAQLRYHTLDSDFLTQLSLQSEAQQSPWPALTSALHRILDDPQWTSNHKQDMLQYVVYQFLRVGMAVVDTFELWYIRSPTAQLEPVPPYPFYMAAREHMEKLWGMMIEDPFFPVPHDARRVLQQVNFKGVFDMFWYHALDSARHTHNYPAFPPLSFVIFQLLIFAAQHHDAADGAIDREPFLTTAEEQNLRRGEDIFPTFVGFRPQGFPVPEIPYEALVQHASENDDDNFPRHSVALFLYGDAPEAWEEFEVPNNLEEVQLVPYGPRIDISTFTTPARDPQKEKEKICAFCPPKEEICAICQDSFESSDTSCVQILVCRHNFHFACLDELVNSGCKTSNKCPNCRVEVCEPRPMRPAEEEDDASMGEPEARPFE